MRAWLAARRAEVRHNTVKKAIGALRAAFAYAIDEEIIDRNPCDGLKNPPDTKVEKVVHEAFSMEEVRLLIEKLPEEWASAVRCCIGTYGQRLGDVLALRWADGDGEDGAGAASADAGGVLCVGEEEV